ncbi:MAG: UDP-N-acetyl-D-mannosamine dehydrogenase [Candidatus Ordinivivax streblomastigis]|uniref:UDP-N-acetyl-D-mannosamine dehydrogenase n=1 Tax=Candidatus Ordinivivax streblomastigis TaxID=2540710 RepID=A0A5M8P3K8_9BACT|nr:MAG: UDP-N-acetyl-D-mannosamine dehydrogenase [Candidatus Ordinivivax streblomastigis]
MKYDVCVIGGCGHVGLPLAIMLASKGKEVCIYDTNEKAIETTKAGIIPFFEEGAEPLLKQVLADNKLHLSNSPEVVSESETAILIIGTPVDEHLNPKFRVMKEVIDDLLPYFYDDQLLVLRSTVYPGLSNRINDWLAEAGKKIHLAFCPERILEGKALEEMENLPQIISSFTEEGVKRASELFSLLTKDLVVVQPMEAELAKLFTNSWRYLKFAVANQFYMIANDYNLDFYNIYHAMTHNYNRTKDFPRPGFAAGPCLFKDTMQLAAFNNNNFFLGHTAMLINEGLPNYVVSQLKKQYTLTETKIGILGMAFKAESDDIRESLSYKLRKILEIEAKQVWCADPYVKDATLVDEAALLAESDIIIIAAPHKQYKNLNTTKRVIDIWNLLNNGGKI